MVRTANDEPIRVTHVATVPMSLLFLRGQPAYMRARGFELRAVTSPGPELDAFGRAEGVPVHAVSMPRRITPIGDLVSLTRLVLHFRQTRPDIVHAHTPKGGLLGTIAAALAGVPVRIYHMRGLPLMGERGARRALLTVTERVSCALATEVFCVSRSLRDVSIELRLAAPEKVRVLAGGSGQGVDARGRFDPDRLDPDARRRARAGLGIPDDALVFGFVGRVVRDKGLRELASAWAGVREALPHARLLVVGPRDGSDVEPSVLGALDSDSRVHAIPVFTDDTPAAYAAMDVVVLPTYREGFPNVPLEAASMRLPVIATRIPGCVDAVEDGITGTLVPARDAAALEQAMLRYGRDPSLRMDHGRTGRARVVREFAREAIWAAMADRYAALHRDVRGRPAGAVEVRAHG